jgi:hypothetical protein
VCSTQQYSLDKLLKTMFKAAAALACVNGLVWKLSYADLAV